MNASRRNLLKSVAVLPLAMGMGLSLADCAAVQNISDLASKATVVTNAIGNIVGPISKLVGTATGIVTMVEGVYSDMKNAAGNLVKGTGTFSAVSVFDTGLAAIRSAVGSVIGKLPSVATIIADAHLVVSEMKAAVGLPAPPAAGDPGAAAAAYARLQALPRVS